jgi:hypothetical protein
MNGGIERPWASFPAVAPQAGWPSSLNQNPRPPQGGAKHLVSPRRRNTRQVVGKPALFHALIPPSTLAMFL